MTKKIHKFFRSKLVFLPLFLTITSCGSNPNLAKVRQFSLLAEQAEKQLPVIASDLYLSCLKIARYKAISLLPTQLDPNAGVSSRLQQRVEAQKDCDQPDAASSPLELSSLMNQGNGIIILYMKKLGQLASDNLLNFDTEFSKLQASSENFSDGLTNLFGASPEERSLVTTQVNAGIKLLQIITEQVLEGKRLDTLNEVIPGANQPLATYAKGLETVLQRVYIDQYLRAEETALNQYYIDYISDIADRKLLDNSSSLLSIDTVLSLEDRWNSEKDKIQQRRQLGQDYIELLQQIVSSHQRLADIYKNGQKPSQKEVKEMMDKNTKALENFVKSSEKVTDQNQK
ncbi:hypothetical protein A2T98_06545 [Nodularia spumigena CENA596]|uniref:Uncharacterized protein n=1 Tax=Nodularia spumigena CENA596 TaxID=1819295 RepID=A0A166K5W8_NODSP|nr:hypothetical protein [Nodularia spumigena]KZL50619.1 hypothetical protein A2T98_06545 [Nodularia spumigena CENA596]